MIIGVVTVASIWFNLTAEIEMLIVGAGGSGGGGISGNNSGGGGGADGGSNACWSGGSGIVIFRYLV